MFPEQSPVESGLQALIKDQWGSSESLDDDATSDVGKYDGGWFADCIVSLYAVAILLIVPTLGVLKVSDVHAYINRVTLGISL